MRFIRGHALRGKTLSRETRQKMSAVRLGKRHTREARERMATAAKRADAHPQWKGENIAYSTLHRWLARVAVKTGACSVCGRSDRSTDWANLSGEYRRDAADFVEMCRSCHRRFDIGRRKAA